MSDLVAMSLLVSQPLAQGHLSRTLPDPVTSAQNAPGSGEEPG